MKAKAIATVLAVGFLAASCSGATQGQNRPNSSDGGVGGATGATPGRSQPNSTNGEVQFICGKGYNSNSNKYAPTTFAWNSGSKVAVIRWETEHFVPSGWTPQKRCEEVSSRFQAAYDNGTLNYLTHGKMNSQSVLTPGTMNNQPVICAATAFGGPCDDLLFTLRPEDDPNQLLQQLANIFEGSSNSPIVHSPGSPQIYIDFERFLREAPAHRD